MQSKYFPVRLLWKYQTLLFVQIYGYCSLVMSREVFCVSEGHRKPETYRANLCDQHKFCTSRSMLLKTEWTVTI